MANTVTIDVKVEGAKAVDSLKKALISLAPAAVPVAAAMAPLVAQTAAAGVAMAAFGAAVIPQVKNLGEAAKAEKKYTDAVAEHGESSKQATKAQSDYAQLMAKMPAETQKAAAAFGILTASFSSWSDSLAKSTMPVFTKSMGVFAAMLPGLTPLVQGAATQLDRLVSAAGGAVANGSFSTMAKQLSEFANKSMDKAIDGMMHLTRLLSEGNANGPIAQFMEYARENGPLVKETLTSISQAVINLLKGAAEAGGVMLTLVNSLAKMVAALPPEFIGTVLKLYTAFKLAATGAALLSTMGAGITALRAQIVAMSAAAAGASGGMAGLTAAIGAMSRGAKLAVATTGIGLLIVGLMELSQMGKKAPADIDRMTTSLGQFARTGKLSGEAARVSGKGFKDFDEAMKGMADPGRLDRIQQSITSFFGQDSTPVKRWKTNLDELDKGLASLVKNGNADLAGAALQRYIDHAKTQGRTSDEVTDQLGDYRSALEDLKFEQQLAADSMGLFGAQAAEVQKKLEGQKKSADGLRESIQALNDVNRAALDGMIGFEAAIDAAAKAASENAGSLKMVNGHLDLNSAKAQAAAKSLSDLAAKTDENTAAARENGSSWTEVERIYARGREALIASAQQMGLTREEAEALANQILKTPDKTAFLRGNLDDLKEKLAEQRKLLKHAPKSETTRILADISNLERQVAVAYDVLNNLDGYSATTWIYTEYNQPHHMAHGGITGAAGGGPRSRMTMVGEHGPELVNLAPGSMVHSNPDSRRMMSDMGGSGAAPMNITVMLGTEKLGEVLIDPIRGAVRKRGGDVQVVLGR